MDALSGFKVIDLSHVIAGPTASHYLAQEGAEVIKVEHPRQGDILRGRRQDRLEEGVSIGFAAINAGKKSLAIDLKHPRCKELLFALIKQADVFIENFRPGSIARLGFDYAAVKAANPKVIYASISGFGQEGRWSPRAAYDHVVQSAIGMGMMQGSAGDDPVKVGFAVVDTATGMIATQAIMAALIRRLRTNRGAYIDLSMAQAGLQLMWPDVARVANTGRDSPRIGNRGFSGSPGAATFPCQDGWISTAANTKEQFLAMCESLGLAGVCDDASLMDFAQAGFVSAKDPERVHAILTQAFSKLPVLEIENRLNARNVPCSRMRLLSEFLNEARANHLLTLPERRTSYSSQDFTDFGAGFKVDMQDLGAMGKAPLLGQDTQELLRSIGVDEAEIKELAIQEAIRIQ